MEQLNKTDNEIEIEDNNEIDDVNDKRMKLKDIETEIKQVHSLDRKNWIKIYKAMKVVKVEKLWIADNDPNVKSFSKWVSKFATSSKIHETILWNRYRAGEVYDNYCKYKAANGETVAPIETVRISPDALVYLEKINKHAPELATKITEDVISSKMKTSELKVMYEAIRPAKPDFSGCDKINHNRESSLRDKVKAAKVLATLSTMRWLGKEDKRFKGTVTQKDKTSAHSTKDKCASLAEFPVFTGTSQKSRRIDLLCIENIQECHYEKYKVNFHGVEIKVDKYDLERDIKFDEYSDFVDYLWLAVTPDLKELAIQKANERLDKTGVVTVDDSGNVKIVKNADRLEPAYKAQALETALLKLM